MSNFSLLIKNIKNYGVVNIFLIVFFEAIYLLRNNYRKQMFYDESKTDTYNKIRSLDFSEHKNLNYNGPYSPTPIFFLIKIKNILKRYIKNNNEYFFIDFGCGAGRSIYFFGEMFKKKLGIDINGNYKKFFKNNEFLEMDLRNIDKFKNKMSSIDSEYYILYFYEPFDFILVKEYINMFLSKKIIIVAINVKKIKDNNINTIYEKEFFNLNRNIRIYSNHV